MSILLTAVPLPFVTLALPLIAAVLMAFWRLYSNIVFKYKKKSVIISLDRRSLKIVLLAVLTANLLLALAVCLGMRYASSALHMLGGAHSWTSTLPTESRLHNMPSMYVDAIGALSGLMISFIAFIAGLRMMADKNNVITHTKAIFTMVTLAGVQGMVYSNGLMSAFIFMLTAQFGASGLYLGVPSTADDFKNSSFYYFSRIFIMAMFFAGAVMLCGKYDADGMAVLAGRINVGTVEKASFALMAAPLLFLFLKSSSYVTEASCRCMFGMRAQVSFFLLMRIIFDIYGPVSALTRIPFLFMSLGLMCLATVVLTASRRRDPVRFAESMELAMKGFIMVSLGISVNGMFSAQGMALYGFSAYEGLSALWMTFLPFSALLSVVCCYLKNDNCGCELWKCGALWRASPVICTSLLVTVCCIAGLPPFVGYVSKQFLYRAANFISPFLTVALFAASVLMLAEGVRYFCMLMFGGGRRRTAKYHGDVTVSLPMALLFIFLTFATMMPGWVFEKCVSPSAESLMNRGQTVDVLTREAGSRK